MIDKKVDDYWKEQRERDKLASKHDDNYWKQQHEIFPHALVPKAYVRPEELTREEVKQAVKLTGNFDIAKRWCKANLKPEFPELHDII